MFYSFILFYFTFSFYLAILFFGFIVIILVLLFFVVFYFELFLLFTSCVSVAHKFYSLFALCFCSSLSVFPSITQEVYWC